MHFLCTQQQQLLLLCYFQHLGSCYLFNNNGKPVCGTANLVYIPKFMQMGGKTVIDDEQHLKW